MHLFGNLIIFILLEIHWVSWMCRLLDFNKFRECSDIISLDIFSTLFSLSSHYSYVGTLDGVPHFSETLFNFLRCLSVLFSACIISIELSSSLLALSSSWNLLSPSSELLISVIVLFNLRISFWFFFLSHMDILYLIWHCHHIFYFLKNAFLYFYEHICKDDFEVFLLNLTSTCYFRQFALPTFSSQCTNHIFFFVHLIIFCWRLAILDNIL